MFAQARPIAEWVRQATESHSVCVSGAARNPSDITIEKSLTLLQAVEKAGGVLPGKKHRALILRFIWRDGHRLIMPLDINLNKIRKGKKQDPELQPADVIYVFSEKFKDNQNSRPCVYLPGMHGAIRI